MQKSGSNEKDIVVIAVPSVQEARVALLATSLFEVCLGSDNSVIDEENSPQVRLNFEERLMPHIRLPKDWKCRATRALSGLEEPGVGAVCFWGGHQYCGGEYSPETQSARLLQCPEYPQDAKRRMQKRLEDNGRRTTDDDRIHQGAKTSGK